MALLAPISLPAVEMYLLRFVVQLGRHNTLECERLYAPLVTYAEMDWTFGKTNKILVASDQPVLNVLTSDHFNLIQMNAEGLNHLVVWYPPRRRLQNIAEARIMIRAGMRSDIVCRIAID